ncbi:hypothetical protein [Microbispora sp. NBRC 16548]|uniref:hypothetical protein n=1 Tax=Microbispora sp. NBRC 16548 TaxID=3030994 RepID=UPI00161D781D|nr:hypothetical protein [Microbispora sp. NBRC 16548]GLX06707.1 hypothetical protein Misp03_36340 [Microbispora sp. NBRC 16548]
MGAKRVTVYAAVCDGCDERQHTDVDDGYRPSLAALKRWFESSERDGGVHGVVVDDGATWICGRCRSRRHRFRGNRRGQGHCRVCDFTKDELRRMLDAHATGLRKRDGSGCRQCGELGQPCWAAERIAGELEVAIAADGTVTGPAAQPKGRRVPGSNTRTRRKGSTR